ncbi:MAG: N-acetyltransferase family protein [Candidatus Kariarchaeaceae archaeon]|jgi:ribosomal protein S18 acetylase RimI-like enzyme
MTEKTLDIIALSLTVTIEYDDQLKFVDAITYEEFEGMMTQCFPGELVDKETFSNNVTRHRYIFIAEKGVPCGYVLFDPTVRPARLIHLCVDDRFRSLGFGALLLQRLIDTLVDLGSKQMILNVDTTNSGAINFYEKFGFVITGSLYQYICDLSKSKEINEDFSLELIDTEDSQELKEKYNLGTNIVAYFLRSQAISLYKILDAEQNMIGYLAYDSVDHIISPMMLDDPEDILEIIASFAGITGDDEEIKINSTRGGIREFIEQSTTISVDYHLQEMTLDIAT